MGQEEWEMVADNHSLEFPGMNREAFSVSQKFHALYNMQVPTGDPTCPPHVRHAPIAKIEKQHNHLENDAPLSTFFVLSLST